MAASWDLLRGDTSRWADRTVYLVWIAESGQPVLDVGCGSGRLLLDFLDLGIDIVQVSEKLCAMICTMIPFMQKHLPQDQIQVFESSQGNCRPPG